MSGRGGCDFCAPATLLADGTVLFPGQYPAQIYDPVTNTFSVAGMMISDHSTAAVLLNGKVLFAGGDYGRSSSAELYDPVRGHVHFHREHGVVEGLAYPQPVTQRHGLDHRR